jgi:hypothetical protein
LTAENLQHMHAEETLNNPVLQAHYTDAELQTIHQRLLRSLTHDQITMVLRWMAPALAPNEQSIVFAGMQKMIAPEGFRDILAMIQPKLGEDVWRRLAQTLRLPTRPQPSAT